MNTPMNWPQKNAKSAKTRTGEPFRPPFSVFFAFFRGNHSVVIEETLRYATPGN
jgi:hypothetical protein